MDPVRTPSSLEATGASENDVQFVIPVSDEELVAATMAGFGTPEVPLDGSRFEAYRFPAPTCPEYAEAVAPRPVPSASNMTTAELANACNQNLLEHLLSYPDLLDLRHFSTRIFHSTALQ